MMDQLEKFIDGRGRWCGSVAQECAKGAKKPGLEDMAKAASIFGEPLRPSGAEHMDIEMIREQMLKPNHRDTDHRGEAETIAIISRRQIKGVFITDDKGAALVAKKESITVATTWQILQLMVQAKWLTDVQFRNHLETLNRANRYIPKAW